MAIGIIACSVLKKEILKVLQGKKNIGEIVFLDAALHLEPDKHRLAVLDAIKSMPEKLGLTQEELARKLGVSWSTVARWEAGQGKPSPLAQKAIEDLLKGTLGEKPKEGGER